MKPSNRPSRIAIVLACLSTALASCAGTGAPRADRASAPLERLGRWMTGSFTSTAQAEALPDDFYDIHLYMQPIWTQRRDGIWLYVEQAAASNLERPYRQRVYHLRASSEGLRSDVYELPGDPLRFAGAWREPARLDEVAREELVERAGCSIFLRPDGPAFVGSTRGEGCSSSLAGAAYATSEVTITRDVLTSWDRGFDAAGEQVWGATAGAYEFVRLP